VNVNRVLSGHGADHNVSMKAISPEKGGAQVVPARLARIVELVVEMLVDS
jgi:hypothetical protein